MFTPDVLKNSALIKHSGHFGTAGGHFGLEFVSYSRSIKSLVAHLDYSKPLYPDMTQIYE